MIYTSILTQTNTNRKHETYEEKPNEYSIHHSEGHNDRSDRLFCQRYRHADHFVFVLQRG